MNSSTASGPIHYSVAETWKEEFKRRPGERVCLRDGTELKPNQRFEGPDYCAPVGKKRQVATVSFFMLPGLDAVESVHFADARPDTVIVEDRRGGSAAYDYTEGLAADDSDAVGKTSAQMGAVMAGERLRVEHEKLGDPASEQYADSYDAALAHNVSAPTLIHATDAFMVYAKEHEIYPGFSDPSLGVLLAGAASDRDPQGSRERRRLETAALKVAPTLVEELVAAMREGRTPSELEVRSLIERVRSMGRDVSSYKVMVREDLARAEADIELARKALVRLLSGEEDGSVSG